MSLQGCSMCVYTTLPLLYKHIVSLDAEYMLCLGSGQMDSPRGVNIIYLGLLLKGVGIHIRQHYCLNAHQRCPTFIQYCSMAFHVQIDVVIMERKETKVRKIVMYAEFVQISGFNVCYLSAGLWTPNFVKSTWTNNVQMESWQWYSKQLFIIFFYFSEMHIWLTHMFHVHLLHRWGPLRSTWQMQVWTQITVHTLFIATSRWHTFALNSLTCA